MTQKRNNSRAIFIDQDDLVPYLTEQKILDFKTLGRGWCYGTGELFNDCTIDKAVKLNREILDNGFLETNAFPGTNGEIMITLYHNDDYLEFTIENNETITFVHEKKAEELAYEEQLSYEDIKHRISCFKEQVCRLSELSTRNSMITRSGDLQALRLRTQARTEVFPLLVGSVSYKGATPFVDISEIITEPFQVFHQSSGSSQLKYLTANAM